MEKIAIRAIILNENGQVLLGKRARGIGIGQWALIGGKPDSNETALQTIRREVKEEIGVRLIRPVLFKEEVNNITIPEEFWRTSYFVGTVEGKIKIKLDEIVEIKYISRKDLGNLDIAFGHDKVLEEFFSRKG